MALVLSAYDLVVRVATLPAGLDGFSRAVPNATFCTDGHLARASFMRADDRAAFAASLGLDGGSIGGADKRTCTANVEWLSCGRYGGIDAVWLREVEPGPLVVPVRWRPGELLFGTWDEMKEQLEYLGLEGNVEVYRDKRTGEKLYTGRTQPTLGRAEETRVDALRKEASELLGPYLLMQRPLGFFEKRKVKKGVGLLQQILAIAPDDWSTLWSLAMILRVLQEEENALAHFRRAYAANPHHPDVGREYAGQCFRMGLSEEGLRVSREVHARFPNDASLQSNLALALLIGGAGLDEALSTARAAQERDPGDEITQNLVRYILDVIAGRAPRPTRLPK